MVPFMMELFTIIMNINILLLFDFHHLSIATVTAFTSIFPSRLPQQHDTLLHRIHQVLSKDSARSRQTFQRHSKAQSTQQLMKASRAETSESSQLPALVEKPHFSVAVVGSGAVGGYYGCRLWEAGHNVSFYMRGNHYLHCKTHGFNMTSIRGNVFIPPKTLQVYNDTNTIGTVDWVICAVKSTGLEAIPDLIYPLLNPTTRVLNIMNGFIEEDLLALLEQRCAKDAGEMVTEDDWSYCAAVYGGMALLCSNRVSPGHVNHSYAGLLSAGVAVSSKHTTPEENQAQFEALFYEAKVDVAYEPVLLRGRWKKNCWNLPFNGISVAMGGVTIDVVVRDPGLRKLAFVVMDEVISIANEDLKQNGFNHSWSLGDDEKKQMMDLSDTMGCYKTSTMLDLVEKRPMEVKHLFRTPLERAARLNVPAPHLETLVLIIEAYQRVNALY